MDRGAWLGIVHEVTESDTKERLTLSLFKPAESGQKSNIWEEGHSHLNYIPGLTYWRRSVIYGSLV